MKCYNHPDQDAVCQCTHCTKGLCRECAEVNPSQPICSGCAKQFFDQELADGKAVLKAIPMEQVKQGILIAWAAFFVISGLLSFIFQANSGIGWLNLFGYFGFGGLPWAIASSRNIPKSAAGKVQALTRDFFAFSPGSAPTSRSAELVGQLLITFLFSPVTTPVRLALAIKNIGTLQKEKVELESIIRNVSG